MVALPDVPGWLRLAESAGCYPSQPA